MTDAISGLAASTEILAGQWRLCVTASGAADGPADIEGDADWVPANVPGTAAGALQDAGQYDLETPSPLHDKDIWYVCDFEVDVAGERILQLDGLATIAEVFLNGEPILISQSMFQGHEVTVEVQNRNRLAICFRALQPHLEQKGLRARWRPQLATSQGLRLVRTTLLGHMPGWCPEIHAVGPYRPVSLIDPAAKRLEETSITATLEQDGAGTLSVSTRIANCSGSVVLTCAGARCDMQLTEGGSYTGELHLPGIQPWMPHTHGEPKLHDLTIETGASSISLGNTGFRHIDIDRGPDGKGFGLAVNGIPVFCRGAVWTNADILNLPGDHKIYRPLLELARDAGMNMLRIGGTMTYETREFFEICDELGILVWQDFQFANYDYPVKDPAFVDTVKAEVHYQLGKTQGCPSLAVLCGGSEIYQQGAMMGLPESRWKGPLTEELLAQKAETCRPDVPYVANSPCEGALPFSPNAGVAHYYGVGAYMRPMEDARRANVRFAAECLAFSNIPEQATLDSHLPAKPGHDPRWKARVPRDRGAGWDFEDVRDHYFRELTNLDPAQLRYGDPEHYLNLSRAVTGTIMETTFDEWRRSGSPCNGALVWTFQDLEAGAGWGVVDATGTPKPAYYSLKRAFRPVQVLLTDEGTNGLDVHLINETPKEKALTLSITCLRDGRVPVVSDSREVTLAPHSNKSIPATDLFGAFFDTTYAYRFGPPAHDVTVARLIDENTHQVLADAYHLPQGLPQSRTPLEISTDIEQMNDAQWHLRLNTETFLQSAHIDAPGFFVSDNWFHLAPGAEKTVVLSKKHELENTTECRGTLAVLNGTGQVTFGT